MQREITSGTLNVEWSGAVDTPWLEVSPVRVGVETKEPANPDQYVLLSEAGRPRLRVDLYSCSGEAYFARDAIVWCAFLVVGWGECVYLIDIVSKTVTRIPLGTYYNHLYLGADYLLVASAEKLFRLGADGAIVWQTESLGVDGVIVHSVKDGIIEGDGEWDPPGGWRPFQLRLDTGHSV